MAVFNLDQTIAIAALAHEGQLDEQGLPYILHVMDVILRCSTRDEYKLAALHDVVGVSDISLEYLAERLEPYIIEALDAITQRDGESDDDYIDRVVQNPLALAVKRQDISANHARVPEWALIDTDAALRVSKRYSHMLERIYPDLYE